jgi:hypothetical protein
MRKIYIVVFLFVVLFFVSGCSKKSEEAVMDLRGEYLIGDCVYLSVASSSTCGIQVDDVVDFDFGETTMKQYDAEGILQHDYQNISYVLVPTNQYLEDLNDPFILFFPKEFLENATARFDIFNNSNSIEYSIFVSGDHYYIAETRMLTSSIDNFMIWSIYELVKK